MISLSPKFLLEDCHESTFFFLLTHGHIYRHCPEDCREAVSSLMSAAARFSDLPELRDLRDTFYERYGNSVELFVNQEVLLDKLTSKKKLFYIDIFFL